MFKWPNIKQIIQQSGHTESLKEGNLQFVLRPEFLRQRRRSSTSQWWCASARRSPCRPSIRGCPTWRARESRRRTGPSGCTGLARVCLIASKMFSFEVSEAAIPYEWIQWTLAYFIRGSITEWLTSYLTGLDSAALLMFNQQQEEVYLFSQIRTSHTGGEAFSDTSSYEMCSLMDLSVDAIPWPRVHFPSTKSTLSQFVFESWFEKDENKWKVAVVGPYFKNNFLEDK